MSRRSHVSKRRFPTTPPSPRLVRPHRQVVRPVRTKLPPQRGR